MTGLYKSDLGFLVETIEYEALHGLCLSVVREFLQNCVRGLWCQR